jgi:hypothetical protein
LTNAIKPATYPDCRNSLGPILWLLCDFRSNILFVFMKIHAAMEQPPEIGANPEPLALANSILWRYLQMPSGGLYAKWDAVLNKAVWFYSDDRDYMFRAPRCQVILEEECDRARFRSVIFRLGSLAGDDLCGAFEIQRPGLSSRRFDVHASFYPEAGIGLWIAITSRVEPDGAADRGQPIQSEKDGASSADDRSR